MANDKTALEIELVRDAIRMQVIDHGRRHYVNLDEFRAVLNKYKPDVLRKILFHEVFNPDDFRKTRIDLTDDDQVRLRDVITGFIRSADAPVALGAIHKTTRYSGFSVSKSKVKDALTQLTTKGVIERVGTGNNTKYRPA